MASNSQFELWLGGMAEAGVFESPSACSDDNFQPPLSKRRNTSKKKTDTRFCSPSKKMKDYKKPFCLDTNKVNTRCALKNFSTPPVFSRSTNLESKLI